jgi:hypothetical protein
MPEPLLPDRFVELERFARAWCLATEAERYAKRRASTMDEMRELYDAAFPKIEEVLAYCDKFPLDDMPDDVRHLLELVYSTIMVAMCIEIWHQPSVVNGADARLERIGEPFP